MGGLCATPGVLCLCLFETVFAGEPQQSWPALHEAGIEAFNANHFTIALGYFQKALPLASSPLRRAATLNDIGNSLRGLGRNADAIAPLTDALTMWRELDASGGRAAETALSLGNADRALGRHADAEKTFRAALEQQPRDPALLNSLGDELREQDRLREAKEKFRAALALAPKTGDDRIDALIGLADVERALAEWSASLAHWSEALTLARDQQMPALEAIALRGLGKTHADRGEFAEAEPLLKRALAMFDAIPELRSHSAAALGCLGAVYRDQKKYGLAEQALRRALELQGGISTANTPAAAVSLEMLATVMALEQRPAEARDLADRAQSIMLAVFGPESPPVAGALGTKGFVERHAGKIEAAERDYSEAVGIMRRSGVLESDMGAEFMIEYAGVLRKLHRERDAKVLESQAKAFRGQVNAFTP